jgi:predicted small integral membrane protein
MRSDRESGDRAPMPPRWTAVGALPVVNGVLVGLNALYVILVAFGNITDFNVNQRFVHHVLAMDTTTVGQMPGTGLDSNVIWRALSAVPLQNAVYIGIIVWELAAGLVLASAVVMWIVDQTKGRTYARRLSTIGLLMIVLLFFGGFIDVGGEWFQMWRSASWNGLDTAFRVAVFAIATVIVIQLPSPPTAESSPTVAPPAESA